MNPVRDQQYFTYVLINKFGQFYTDCTNDLKHRIDEHSKGKSTFSNNHRPYKLVYFESYLDKTDAYARERYLKSGMGKQYIKNRLKHFLERL